MMMVRSDVDRTMQRALESLGSPGSKDGRHFCVGRGWEEMKLQYGYLGKEAGDHEEFSA